MKAKPPVDIAKEMWAGYVGALLFVFALIALVMIIVGSVIVQLAIYFPKPTFLTVTILLAMIIGHIRKERDRPLRDL